MAESKLWYIRRFNFFPALTEQEKVELATHSRMIECKRGLPVHLSEADSDRAYLIKKGTVKMSIRSPNGKKLTVAILQPGEIIGEMAVLGDDEPGEIAEAMSDSLLCEVSAPFLRELLHRRPELALQITKLVGLRRKQIRNRIQDVLFLTVSQRIARLLLKLADEFPGETTGGRRFINLRIKHKDIADLVGSNREAVSFCLSRFNRDGLAKPVKRYLVLTDEEGLRKATGDGK